MRELCLFTPGESECMDHVIGGGEWMVAMTIFQYLI